MTSKQVTPEDLLFVESSAISYFKDAGIYRIAGMQQKPTIKQQVSASYIEAVVALLVKKGILKLEDAPFIPRLEESSNPPEEDYEY